MTCDYLYYYLSVTSTDGGRLGGTITSIVIICIIIYLSHQLREEGWEGPSHDL